MTKVICIFELKLERTVDGLLPTRDRNRLPRILAESLSGSTIHFHGEEWTVRKTRVRHSGRVTAPKVMLT